MNLLVNPVFWYVTLAIYLLVYIRVPFQFSLWFGVLNSVALSVILGVNVAWLLLLFSFTLWTILKYICFLRKNKLFFLPAALFLSLLTAVFFIVNKLHIQGFLMPLDSVTLFSGAMNLGLSFLAVISYSFMFLRVIDLMRMVVIEKSKLVDPISLVGYLAPFHMLIAGPVCSYTDYLKINSQPLSNPTFSKLLSGVNTITTGLFYKLVIAEGMKIMAFGVHGEMHIETWLESAYGLIYIYFDFAGYSLVALGIGEICGIPTPRNFQVPFAARSVTQFWTRWHISLGNFVRRNIFMPLQLRLMRTTSAQFPIICLLLSLITAFTFVGLWHGISLRMVLWGLSMGIIMALEKVFRDYCLRFKWSQSLRFAFFGKLLGPVYVFVVIVTSIQFIAVELFG